MAKKKDYLTNIYPSDLTAILASKSCRLPKDRRWKTADRRKTALSAVNRRRSAVKLARKSCQIAGVYVKEQP